MSTTTGEYAPDLAAAVREELRAGAGVARVARPAGGADAMQWLRRMPAGSRRYWHSREGDDEAAGAGVALAVDGHRPLDLEAALAALPAGAAAWITGRFDPRGTPAPEWASFGHVRAVLPRLEMRVTAEDATLACHVTDADRRDPSGLEAALKWLSGAAEWGDGMPAHAVLASGGRVSARHDRPDLATWTRAISRSLDAFGDAALRKVVLARRSTWDTAEGIDPLAALTSVAAHAPSCFHVLVEVGDGAFVSATPERLFRLEGGHVSSEAVAGTVAGDSPVAVFLEKDVREHALVVDDVRNRLAGVADGVRADGSPGVLKLSRRRHLRTRIDAALHPGIGPLEILTALHPTPAVGGTPREPALDFIRDAEGFDRGLYAGYVGRVERAANGELSADVAVGIRSALLEPSRASLYAGAGIVPGSDAQSEWDEVEGKMSDMARALGLPWPIEA